MEYVRLNDEVSVSRIVQGFWRLMSWYTSETELASFIENCINLGVTTFDTAEIYSKGECETCLGKALKKVSASRCDIQIVSKTGISNGATKYYDTRYESIIEA